MSEGGYQKSDKLWYINSGVRGFDLNTLPRCQAVTKTTNRRCKNPAMKGRKVCCVHAGLYKPGAPKGNKNSLKHGMYSAEAIADRKTAQELLNESAELLDEILGLNVTGE